MSKTRVFRILVCALLICSLLINCCSIRAEATVVAPLAVTGAGVMATLFAMGMGIVAVDLTAQAVNAIGESMSAYLYQWGTSAEKQDEVKNFLTLLPPSFDNGSDDDSGDDDGDDGLSGFWAIPAAILGGLVGWASSLINGEGVEVEGEAPEGYAYYNGYLFPDVSSVDTDVNFDIYDHALISAANELYWVRDDVRHRDEEFKYYSDPGGSVYAHRFTLVDNSWVFDSYFYAGSTPKWRLFPVEDIIWANYDVLSNTLDSGFYLLATDPVSAQIGVIKPDVYVGDIPQQIQDGTFDEEKYELPYINYGQLFQGQTDVVTALNDVAAQLQNQTMTYDQYMEQIKTEVDTNTGTDSGTATDPWDPPEDPGAFALDLTKFFPFCIPFDLYDFLTCLNADPVAPVISWDLPLPGGSTFPIELDLSPFDSVAQLLRRLQLLLFIVGLAIKTRDLIKG